MREEAETTSWKRLLFFVRFFSTGLAYVTELGCFLLMDFVDKCDKRCWVEGRKSSWSVFSLELLIKAAKRPVEFLCGVVEFAFFPSTKKIVENEEKKLSLFTFLKHDLVRETSSALVIRFGFVVRSLRTHIRLSIIGTVEIEVISDIFSVHSVGYRLVQLRNDWREREDSLFLFQRWTVNVSDSLRRSPFPRSLLKMKKSVRSWTVFVTIWRRTRFHLYSMHSTSIARHGRRTSSECFWPMCSSSCEAGRTVRLTKSKAPLSSKIGISKMCRRIIPRHGIECEHPLIICLWRWSTIYACPFCQDRQIACREISNSICGNESSPINGLWMKR